MFFNTPQYIGFFIIFFILFVLTNRMKLLCVRNMLFLACSYLFYAQLHIWFVYILLYTTLVNYLCGLWIAHCQRNGASGKAGVITAVVLSIGVLVFFKYAYLVNKSVFLPVGLSFFTFQALTYTIDLYRKKIASERNILDVALFIAFFPTLLSGPIERSRNLMPQLKRVTVIDWNNVTYGAGLFLWGLFKKTVIADRLALYVNMVYYNPYSQTGSTLALAALCYSFQIYCDFSGYADMSIGSGRILGLRISPNFNFPYCANTIKEFWHRWHISLTSWFTEYVYISMGGNRVARWRWIINIMTIFVLSGVWHGATWSFVLWGAMHGIFYLGEHWLGPKRPNWIYHILVFVLVSIAWVFFRIENVADAFYVVAKIFTDIVSPLNLGSSSFSTLLTLVLLILFIFREVLMYRGILSRRSAVEYMLILLTVCLFGMSSEQFVYFQF